MSNVSLKEKKLMIKSLKMLGVDEKVSFKACTLNINPKFNLLKS